MQHMTSSSLREEAQFSAHRLTKIPFPTTFSSHAPSFPLLHASGLLWAGTPATSSSMHPEIKVKGKMIVGIAVLMNCAEARASEFAIMLFCFLP